MIVYTAARLQNLAQADADKVAQFIRISTTEGQRPGSGNGQLPGGLPPDREDRRHREALRRPPHEVADAVEAQQERRRRPDRRRPGGSTAGPAGRRPWTPPRAA